jgi:putative PIN family toxin of toxin-antitoxin system
MRIVLDTNVLVSGLLSPFGPPGEIVRLVSSGDLVLCLDARLLSEYHDVLARPRFRFDPDDVAALLEYVEYNGEMIAARPLERRLPDRDDEPFLEVALAGDPECLVTGNLAHYPAEARAGAVVLTPAEFIERFRSGGRAGGSHPDR